MRWILGLLSLLSFAGALIVLLLTLAQPSNLMNWLVFTVLIALMLIFRTYGRRLRRQT